MKGLLIQAVTPGSIASALGVTAGDRLMAINDNPLRDIIDYSFHSADSYELVLDLLKADGELWALAIELEAGEPLGIIFTTAKPAYCRNSCIFCFVHQLPKGLRKTLYMKDEDYRLSFLNGNYITMANLKPAELRRITLQRLSPLYISVHATNPSLREQLLGAHGIPPILEQLRKLADARIAMHTQVVLCPGFNDSAELERTVADLSGLYPAVRSLAIVPVGLTSHRRGLPDLTPVDGGYARSFIETWLPRARLLRKQLREPFLFLADEFFLMAGIPFPPLRDYGDLPQIENGVGLVPLFLRDSERVLRKALFIGHYRVMVLTGVSAYGFVKEFLGGLAEKTGIEIVLTAVESLIFGKSVTVSGLVAGNDILHALHGIDTGLVLMVPDIMLKEGEGLFLDDLSLCELGQQLGCRVMSFNATPQGFYQALREIPRQYIDEPMTKPVSGK